MCYCAGLKYELSGMRAFYENRMNKKIYFLIQSHAYLPATNPS